MCRLLGIVASEPTEFGVVLTEAPRCLATLSREHPDGWGIAIHDADRRSGADAVRPLQAVANAQPPSLDGDRETPPPSGPSTERAGTDRHWRLHRGTERAGEDRRFREIATRSRGHVLVAHIRQKTVGPTRIENSHPFTRDGWAFAHNGTVQACDVLRAGCSPQRLAEIAGDTDSELLFAFFLSRLDERGLLNLESDAARDDATALIGQVSAALRAQKIGAFNFLLSDGITSFAHRCGRSLFLLERTPNDPVREERAVAPGTSIVTKWTTRRHAVFVASERITDEPWRELPDGTFMRIDRVPTPRVVCGDPEASSENAANVGSKVA